jgi:3,4-dihydroxy 2-butanone 4-phosphate synthase/GTP cyclohydrolase II
MVKKNQYREGKNPQIEEMRDYGVGAQILAEIGVHDMILLSNAEHSLVALEGYGLNIIDTRPVGDGEHEWYDS